MQNDLAIRQYIDATLQKTSATFDLLPGVVLIQNSTDGTVEYISKRGEQLLGLNAAELKKIGPDEYHKRFFNQEEARVYVPEILGFVKRNNTDEVYSFFQQLRFTPGGDWILYATTTKIFLRDDGGNPLLLLTFSMQLNPEHHFTAKVERLIEENNFLRKHQKAYSALTKREKSILQQMAIGKAPKQIAQELFISIETAKTHRRNIIAKLGTQNNYDLTRFAHAFDLLQLFFIILQAVEQLFFESILS